MAATLFAAVISIVVIHYGFKGADFVPNVPDAASKLIASLIIVTLLIERSLAAINAAAFGSERKKQEGVLWHAEPDHARQSEAERARTALLDIAGKEERLRVLIGFCFALLVSAAGVRTLQSILVLSGLQSLQQNFAYFVDILLTAGLIAGGSNGLSDLLKIIKGGMTPPKTII